LLRVVVEGQIPFGMTPERQRRQQQQQQISPLRCEMTNKRTSNGDSRLSSGDDKKKGNGGEFGREFSLSSKRGLFRNGNGY
jgi:hypothetical protein